LSIHGELDECVRDIAKMEGGCDGVSTSGASIGEKSIPETRRGRKTKVRVDACDDDGTSMASVKVCDDDPDLETMTAAPDVTVANVDLTDVHHKAIEAKKLKNMGFMTAVAIGLHNFPEGLATFVAALADPKLGGALAIAIAIHNIPEGICVAMPIYYATGSKWKGFWWSFLSGLSEPLGAIVGYAILRGNAMSDAAFGSLFGCVAGMMIFVSIKELIPTALKYDPHDVFVTNYVFVGMAVMALSLVLFYV
jgi:ZIP family zinc transporter